VNLKLSDIDVVSREITVRQGKGRKDRVVPLVGQALEALKAYLAVREESPEFEQVFLARNGTSMDQRTVRYRIHKYYEVCQRFTSRRSRARSLNVRVGLGV
jgi:integrase/recombinase XerD